MNLTASPSYSRYAQRHEVAYGEFGSVAGWARAEYRSTNDTRYRIELGSQEYQYQMYTFGDGPYPCVRNVRPCVHPHLIPSVTVLGEKWPPPKTLLTSCSRYTHLVGLQMTNPKNATYDAQKLSELMNNVVTSMVVDMTLVDASTQKEYFWEYDRPDVIGPDGVAPNDVRWLSFPYDRISGESLRMATLMALTVCFVESCRHLGIAASEGITLEYEWTSCHTPTMTRAMTDSLVTFPNDVDVIRNISIYFWWNATKSKYCTLADTRHH